MGTAFLMAIAFLVGCAMGSMASTRVRIEVKESVRVPQWVKTDIMLLLSYQSRDTQGGDYYALGNVAYKLREMLHKLEDTPSVPESYEPPEVRPYGTR